jgi:hypothetical protein
LETRDTPGEPWLDFDKGVNKLPKVRVDTLGTQCEVTSQNRTELL